MSITSLLLTCLTPTFSEVFAESRGGSLGYQVYVEFAVMSCSLIDEMIGKSEFASAINSQALVAR